MSTFEASVYLANLVCVLLLRLSINWEKLGFKLSISNFRLLVVFLWTLMLSKKRLILEAINIVRVGAWNGENSQFACFLVDPILTYNYFQSKLKLNHSYLGTLYLLFIENELFTRLHDDELSWTCMHKYLPLHLY